MTIIVPTRNGQGELGACLDGILRQALSADVEVIVIDSGSTDGTVAIATQRRVRVVGIRPEEFNHGATRNLGVQLARGDFIVMTVQDARAVDDRWIQKMMRHFEDPEVAAVCGQQVVPHDGDKNPLKWFRPYSEPQPRLLRFSSPEEFDRLSPRDQAAACAWDDVTAMYRRSALLRVPFQPVVFGEDMLWARDALRSRMSIVYDYAARVYHYHREDFAYRFRREIATLYGRYLNFDLLVRPRSLVWGLLTMAGTIVRRKYCPQNRLAWLLYNARLLAADWVAGWAFWFAARVRGRRAVVSLHARVCRTVPEPRRAQPA